MDPTDTARTEAEGRRERPGDGSGPLATRRTLLKATGAGVAASGLGAGTVGTAGASEHGINTPWLHVEGNRVLDPLGNEVILRGVNIPDPKRLDHTVPARGKNWDHMIDLATNHERGWYANVIRIPVHPGDVGEEPPVPEADVDVHMPPTFQQEELVDYCENYLDDVVEYCRQQNVYCIVDYHRHWGEGELEWTDDALDEEVRMFWDTVAPRYAEDPHVIFEVYNEPTNPAMYVDEWYTPKYAGIWRMWKQTCQPWVDVIREHAPDNLIVVGTPGWSAMPEGAQIEEFDGGNLMYAYHIYGGHGLSSDEEFDSRETEEGTNSVWEDVPLFMTEFGWEPNTGQWISGTTDGFGSAVTEWADDRPIHWTAWCFDITWLPSMWERSFVDDDPDDSVGDPYSEEIPEHCPDPPCEWDLLGRDVGDYDDYAGEYIRETLETRRNDDVPQVDHDDTPPAAPADLSASGVDSSSASLSWSAVSDTGETGLSHYAVTVDGEDWLETTSTSADVDDLLAGHSHDLGVSGVDEYGNVGTPATVEVTTDAVSASDPGQPAGLTLSDRTHTSVTLSWEAPAGTDVARYVVYREGEEVARLRSGETSYRIDGLELDAQVDVAVQTVDRAGNEGDPLSAVVEPRPAHAADDDVLVNDFEGDGSENSLGGWTGGSLLSDTSGGTGTFSWDGIVYYGTTIDLDVTDTPNLKIKARGESGYEISMLALKAGDADDGVPIGDVTDDRIGTEWSVVTIDLEEAGADLSGPGQLQFDAVWGTQGHAELDEIWLAGEDDPAEGLVSSGSGDRPDAPSNVTATADSETQITVSWDLVADADHYVVTGDHEAETTDTSVIVDGLQADTTYEFGVAAVADDGTQSLTRTATATTDGGTGEDPCQEVGAADGEQVDGQWVCDVDDDGLHRDVTADGEVGQDDVVHFFENQHRDDWKQPDLFDFSGSESVGHGDVVALFEHVSL